MAAENHPQNQNRNSTTNPIIIEPPDASSSDPSSTSSHLLAATSLNSSSSSSSINSSSSSRPESPGIESSNVTTPLSSDGSPSPSPPASRDVDVELRPIGPPPPPPPAALDGEEEEPLSVSANHRLSPNQGPQRTRTSSSNGLSSSSSSSERTEGSSSSQDRGGVGRRSAWRVAYHPMLARRRWMEHSLGIFGLVASLVGLLFIGVRTYKLAVISTENSTLEGCTGLIQAGFVTLENSTSLCKAAMRNGPLSSPYHLSKRTLHSSLTKASQWMEELLEQTCRFPYIKCQPQVDTNLIRNLSSPAIIISTTLLLGGLIIIIARRNARSTEVFTSPAYSDIHVTRHKDSGPQTVTGQGVLEKRNSADEDLSEIHKQIRASQDQDKLMKDTAPLQSSDSSCTTLVEDCREPKVSLEDKSSGEKHEGLIELQMNGHTKAFFKLETGELFHLKHWKDKCKDVSHSSHHKEDALSIQGEDATRHGSSASKVAKRNAIKDE